jgi:prepilin-type processing-associated H-X9-DG protein
VALLWPERTIGGFREWGVGSAAAAATLGVPVTTPEQMDSYYQTAYALPTWTFAGGYYYLGAKPTSFPKISEKYMLWDSDRNDYCNSDNDFPVVPTIAVGDNTSFPAYDAAGGAFAFRHSGLKYLNMLYMDNHVELLGFDPYMQRSKWFSTAP